MRNLGALAPTYLGVVAPSVVHTRRYIALDGPDKLLPTGRPWRWPKGSHFTKIVHPSSRDKRSARHLEIRFSRLKRESNSVISDTVGSYLLEISKRKGAL